MIKYYLSVSKHAPSTAPPVRNATQAATNASSAPAQLCGAPATTRPATRAALPAAQAPQIFSTSFGLSTLFGAYSSAPL